MLGEPSPGLWTLLQSGASPSSGTSEGSPRELRKSGSAGVCGKRQEGLQQMNTQSRGERTIGIIAGIEMSLYEEDLERGIESSGKGMTHLCLCAGDPTQGLAMKSLYHQATSPARE